MPPLASRVVNTGASNLIATWILSLTNYQFFTNWQMAILGSTNCVKCGADKDYDGDGVANYLEFLTRTDPLNANNYWTIAAGKTSGSAQIIYPQSANRGFEIQFTTNIISPRIWTPLDVPDNRPFFSVTNRTGIVNDPLGGDNNRIYRVRVFEP
jgi:hypothetical protein